MSNVMTMVFFVSLCAMLVGAIESKEDRWFWGTYAAIGFVAVATYVVTNAIISFTSVFV